MKKILICVFAAADPRRLRHRGLRPHRAAEREEAVYRTGSNIPTRQRAGDADGVKTYDREALDRARNETAPVPRGGIPGSRPGS